MVAENNIENIERVNIDLAYEHVKKRIKVVTDELEERDFTCEDRLHRLADLHEWLIYYRSILFQQLLFEIGVFDFEFVYPVLQFL